MADNYNIPNIIEDTKTRFASYFKEELIDTKIELSETMYKY